MLLVWKHELKIICIDIGSRSSLSTDDNLTNWLYVEYRISFKILFNLIKNCKIVGYWIFFKCAAAVGRPTGPFVDMWHMFGLT